MLLLGQAYSLVDLLTREDLGNAHMPGMLFGMVSVIVASLWGRWWYAQREVEKLGVNWVSASS